MKDLDTLRKEIDEYDKEIIKYYERRMEAVLNVMAFKYREKIPVFQEGREQQVLNRVIDNLTNKSFEEETRLLYKEIMRISRKRQSKELFPYNIVLIGFMGTGKSSISRILSQMLEMEWVDTDILLEEKMDMTIGEIFDKHGEERFREIETEMINEVMEKNNRIISCGGGIPLKEENIKSLKSNGKIVLLDASAETIYKRLKHDITRPLLKNKISLEFIEQMLKQRENAYISACDITVSTNEKDTHGVAMEIIDKLLDM